MAAEDYFIDFIENYDDPEDYETTCSRCGEGGLSWGNDGRKWYLIDADCRAHTCKPENIARRAAKDFE